MLKNFIYKNKEKVESKIDKFRKSGYEKLYLLADFDRTITSALDKKGGEVSTWELMSRKMPADKRAEEIKRFKKYRPLEISGKMTEKDAIYWWSANLDLYKESSLKWSDLALEITETIPARQGAQELFDICHKKDIPAIIISAGIKNVIELWCDKFNINPQTILSTELNFDSGYICGWNKDSLVHTFNKNEVGKEYLDKVHESRPLSILIGDSMDDAVMVGGDDNVLRIFIDNHHDIQTKDPDFYNKVFAKFDLIIDNESLMPIVDIIKSIE